jgi:two-component system phosphate regulon response regulator OmpR
MRVQQGAIVAIRVLILDDESEMRALLQRYLNSQGFAVQVAQDAAQLDTLLARSGFDVLVLDVMMPGEDGLSICRRLRAAGETIPIMMLTARGDPVDRIIGLEMGADDYLPKPFEPRELAARLNALARRQAMYAQGSTKAAESTLAFGPFSLDFAARRLYRDGQEVPLTSGEYTLLHSLAANPNRTLGRDRLLELLQKLGPGAGGATSGRAAAGRTAPGRDEPVTARSIDVQILRLRRLLEDDPAKPRYIQTVWGKGYVFVLGGTPSGGEPSGGSAA